MELHEALSQIGEIRLRLARTETVVPSRSLTVGGVGLLASPAAWCNRSGFHSPRPTSQPTCRCGLAWRCCRPASSRPI